MKKKIVFATNNSHKLEEIRKIAGNRFEIVSLAEIGCFADIPEEEPTLRGNALAKARFVHNEFGIDCFADDTGLEVDALNGEPGVRSARYAPGDGHDSAANMRLLLKNMEGIKERNARFRTAIALIFDGKEYVVDGIVEGEIATEPSGNEGFGYDPIFIPEKRGETFAEMSADEKNKISHRGRATAKLIELLEKL